MIDITVKQSWLEKSGETALEEYKSVVATILNNFPEDRHAGDRWSITQTSESNAATLIYDERPIGTFIFEDSALHFQSHGAVVRYDDLMYALRAAADRLYLAVYSHLHNSARLPQDYRLALDHTIFTRDGRFRDFFEKSDFIPRFATEGMETFDDGRQALSIYPPYFAEHKHDGAIYVLNNAMLSFLITKDNQAVNKEFAYKVAENMQDFARKYDLGLIPSHFYQNFGHSTKIINQTYFDVANIHRKVFIDPYIWDFDDTHDYRYYRNVETGMHLMDKIRKGETLDEALKRVLNEEFKVARDYVGARIWGIEFDRDREDILTPRLKINIFVNGMVEQRRSQNHDWVSIR